MFLWRNKKNICVYPLLSRAMSGSMSPLYNAYASLYAIARYSSTNNLSVPSPGKKSKGRGIFRRLSGSKGDIKEVNFSVLWVFFSSRAMLRMSFSDHFYLPSVCLSVRPFVH